MSTQSTNKFGLHLLREAEKLVLRHFEEAKQNHYSESTWISGWLDAHTIAKLEKEGHKIECSTESGEYFYKIIFSNT